MAARINFGVEIDSGLPASRDRVHLNELVGSLRRIPGLDARLDDNVEPVRDAGSNHLDHKGVVETLTLLVSVGASSHSLKLFTQLLSAWFERIKAREVRIKIGGGTYVFKAISAHDQRRLVELMTKLAMSEPSPMGESGEKPLGEDSGT